MKYPLLIVSRVDTAPKNSMVILTFYPTASACITPQQGSVLVASYAKHFEPAIELADALSEKGKRRLKLVLTHPSFNDEERRSLGTLYYSLLFGHNPGNDESKKNDADTIYSVLCDLHQADTSTEDAWTNACEDAISRLHRLAESRNA